MRTLIIALLALATGAALTATVLHTPTVPVTNPGPASTASGSAAAASPDTNATTDDGLLPTDGWPRSAPSPNRCCMPSPG